MKYSTTYMRELRNELVDKFMALLDLQRINRKSKWTDIDGSAINKAANDFDAVLIKVKRLK